MDFYIKNLVRELKIRNYGVRTVKAYKGALERFLKFNDGDVSKAEPVELVKDFLFYQKERGVAPKTLHVYLSALKFFFREVLNVCFDMKVKFAKRPRRLPVVLSYEEIRDIIGSLDNFKHRLIISLAYGSGLRVGEVTRLKVFDLNFSDKTIFIRQAKGGKDRYSIMPRVLKEDLSDYISNKQ